MAIDMWIELDLPSGYLLHSHGESPFLSSVNHLFLCLLKKSHPRCMTPEGALKTAHV